MEIRILLFFVSTFFITSGGAMNIISMNKIDLIVSQEKENEMVAFYQNTFEFKLYPSNIQGHTFYDGKLPNLIEIRFVPAELVKVHLDRNRIQLNFQVKDLQKVIKNSLGSGGTQYGEISQTSSGNRIFSVIDPDGNFVVFSEQ